MSYNTRRSTGFGSTPQQQQSAASVGQRRPVVTNNFVPGGQLAGNQQQQQKPAVLTQQQQRPPQQQPQQAGINFRSQAGQQGQQQQNYQSQSYSTQQQPPQPLQQARYPQAPQIKQEPRPVQQQPAQAPQVSQVSKPVVQPSPAPAPAPAPIVPGANPPAPENNGDSMETNADGTKKKPWFKSRGRVTKAEKVRRRNLRLSKILQPKNAVMILNELVKGCQYVVVELPCKIDANQFRAAVTFEEKEFAGTGRTKNNAKNAAAETALKYLVKNKQLNVKKEEDSEGGDEKMEIGEEDGTQVMPWSHIASFAMYKLFSTWGEDPSAANKAQELMGTVPKPAPAAPTQRAEPKPAKKMPENPERMNPLMLMNQMLPHAQWDEVGKSGVPPNVVFTYSVTVDEKQFTGTGINKKSAKKLAAFAACHEILKIDYPADVWVPLY